MLTTRARKLQRKKTMTTHSRAQDAQPPPVPKYPSRMCPSAVDNIRALKPGTGTDAVKIAPNSEKNDSNETKDARKPSGGIRIHTMLRRRRGPQKLVEDITSVIRFQGGRGE